MSEIVSKVRIQTNSVSIFYGEKCAVDSVSLGFRNRSVTALIGPSGCGKSTFLRAINRMNDFIPQCRITGSIFLDGHNIYDPQVDPVVIRRQVGMVFQKPNPFPKSIFDNVAWGPRRAGVPKTQLEDLVISSLKEAALWDEVKDRLKQSALSLSGGQQQRLCIARAIAMHPSVLLMDEPCSALDPIATARIEELIARLKSQFSIIVVTHNMQQAARISDSTAFFLNGRLVEWGETRSLFTRPQIQETENYLTGKFG